MDEKPNDKGALIKPLVPTWSNEKLLRRRVVASAATKAACDELRVINSWAELGRVCAKQIKTRGW